MTTTIAALKEMSSWVANDISHIQGAGGNSSVKTDNGQLIIKASGKTMLQLIEDNAFVIVDSATINAQLINEHFDITDKKHRDEMAAQIKASVVEKTNPDWQPSMETPFHTLGYKYTLHTHNAWSNILMCSNHFDDLSVLFADVSQYTLSSLGDYYTPGIPLSWHIYDSYRFEEEWPNVIFLPNHGVIYSHDNLDQLKKIVDEVQHRTLSYLKAKATEYPTYQLLKNETSIEIVCPFLMANLNEQLNSPIFHQLLFPDQAIYILPQHFSFTDKNALFYVNTNNGTITSNTNEQQTKAVIETALAFCFIWQQCAFRSFEPLTINWEWENLVSLETEQHRIKMLQQKL